jgi:hypothetical protein
VAADPQTYGDLQQAIVDYLQDASLAPRAPQLIALAERRLSRKLNTPEMEVATTLPLSSGAASFPLPTGFMELRSVYVDNGIRVPLSSQTQADLNQDFASLNTGVPTKFSLVGGDVYVRPLPDRDYTVTLTYKSALPPLSDTNQTNWLLSSSSDLYLFSSILHAEFYGWNDQRLPLLKGVVDELIDEVNQAGSRKRYGTGPLVMKAPVTDFQYSNPYQSITTFDPSLLDTDSDSLLDG